MALRASSTASSPVTGSAHSTGLATALSQRASVWAHPTSGQASIRATIADFLMTGSGARSMPGPGTGFTGDLLGSGMWRPHLDGRPVVEFTYDGAQPSSSVAE